MEKHKNSKQFNKNNVIVGVVVVALLAITGILPAIVELVVGLIGGIIGLVIGLIGGFIGLVVGLFGAVIGIVFGLLPIIVMVGIVVVAVKAINGEVKFERETKAKRKNEDYV